ncbi:hypothetical protein [Burkholderia gladioli]|uniref:hypothetical protein n=1 Tax=Burkholderia gladioli TaxID=28095 RepID=UPI001F34C7FD|nr:hypothetical protein [Burkholderia gladioli]MDN7495258.1 hypothetical protein [Burkholderia gladioli]MDN7600288.1 hypothetical protein [Burkholderia gladioli]
MNSESFVGGRGNVRREFRAGRMASPLRQDAVDRATSRASFYHRRALRRGRQDQLLPAQFHEPISDRHATEPGGRHGASPAERLSANAGRGAFRVGQSSSAHAYTHDLAGSSRANLGYADTGTLPYGIDVLGRTHNPMLVEFGVQAQLEHGVALSLARGGGFGFEDSARDHTFLIKFKSKF